MRNTHRAAMAMAMTMVLLLLGCGVGGVESAPWSTADQAAVANVGGTRLPYVHCQPPLLIAASLLPAHTILEDARQQFRVARVLGQRKRVR